MFQLNAPGGTFVSTSPGYESMIVTEESLENALDEIRTAVYNDRADIDEEISELRASNMELAVSLREANAEISTLRASTTSIASEIQICKLPAILPT